MRTGAFLASSLILFGIAAVTPAAAADKAKVTPGNEPAAKYLGERLEPTASPPKRRRGRGPFDSFVIRGATLIDGTGAPPIGPVNIVISGNRISEIKRAGTPFTPAGDEETETGDYELDATGMYVLPGFVNSHGHIGNPEQDVFGEPSPAEYVFKLWLAHGVTTIREVGTSNGLDWTLKQKRASASNDIAAPRIFAYARFSPTPDPDAARKWVRAVAKKGADGIKFFGASPEVMKAALEEARKLGLETTMHHDQLAVSRWNVLDSARAGMTSMEHWYGLPEALFEDRRVQNYPANYNYSNEEHRFGEAGRLWKQAAAPGSARWNAVLEELLALDFTLDPTFTVYDANRDFRRARNLEWLPVYTWPTLERYLSPTRKAHGSYFYNWTTAREIDWKENFRLWMTFINDFKNRGGRVTTGEDGGYIYDIFGFGYIRELELLQEAGFHPLEVVTAATLNGAEVLGLAGRLGSVETGKMADLVIVDQNPLANFKVLYGNGALRLNDETDELERVGGVRWTIKDGILFDAKKLLADVKQMVDHQRAKEAAESKD